MPPKVLLINPWIHDFAAVNMWIKPLGLLKVAEYLSQFNLDLKLIDCLDEYFPDRKYLYRYPKHELASPQGLEKFPRKFYQYGIDEQTFLEQLKKQKPDIILVTSLMTYWYTGAINVIDYCKEMYPDVPLIQGGLYARLFPQHAQDNSKADIVYTGLANQELKKTIETLGFTLKATGQSKPWYDLGFYDELHYAPLLTSQGCPYHCPYCASQELSPNFKQYSPQQIINDINQLAGRGVTDFAFYDDALLYHANNHIDVILENIPKDNSYRFHTPNGLHARYINEQTAQLMFKTNFQTIRLSLETINYKRQLETGNKIQNDQFAKAIDQLKRAGFQKHQLGVYLMYGLPDQPLEELWAGIRFLEQLDVRIHFTELSPLPGTSTWQTLIDQNIITNDIDPLLTNNTVFASQFTNFTWDNIRALREEVSRINQATS